LIHRIDEKNEVMKEIQIEKKKIAKKSIGGFSKMVVLTIVIMVLSVLNSFSQNDCKVILKAKNNRTTKTIQNLEYTYTLFLENADSLAYEYSLTGLNNNDECTNPDGLPIISNIDLSIILMDSDLNPINENVFIAPGESFKFYLKLKVPENSPFDTWNCTEVKADVIGCDSAILHLHTFNPNPETLE